MGTIPYVSEHSARLAEEWERRFRDLPPSAGVLFVGIKACPELTGESSIYEVRLGICRKYEEATGTALVKHVLGEEINSRKYRIQVAVYRGSRGSAGDAIAGPHSTQEDDRNAGR